MIAGLSSAFRIKWRDVEYDFDFVAFAGLLNQAITLEERLHHALGIQPVVADEGSGTDTRRHVAQGRPCRFVLESPGLSGSRSLFFDGRFKAGFVDPAPVSNADLANAVHQYAASHPAAAKAVKQWAASHHLTVGKAEHYLATHKITKADLKKFAAKHPAAAKAIKHYAATHPGAAKAVKKAIVEHNKSIA